jgi:hypothetical protein
VFRGDRAKDAELLVLRHDNAVLRRHAGRVRYEPGDRVAHLAGAAAESLGTESGAIPRSRRSGWSPDAGHQPFALSIDRCPAQPANPPAICP